MNARLIYPVFPVDLVTKKNKKSMNINMSEKFQTIKTSDGSSTFYSEEYQQTYHSKHGAVSECEHIYLNTSGVAERLKKGQATRVLEVGFGTGLNFLVTANLAQETGTKLEYWGIEKEWLPEKVFQELDHSRNFTGLHDMYSSISSAGAGGLNNLENKSHTFPFLHNIELHILLGDACELEIPNHQFHAIYHDAFSPDANPELWTSEFFTNIKSKCAQGAILSTYSSKKAVQRALHGAGFVVEKQPGPWGKRDILRAIPD
ncbi:MAG: hypothetical protein DWQ05_08470 [Calditrichaeota bacterium]|nr:MAG: hypothetical protein DWQ05_08470 [Calditrichota bacterium]